MIEDSLRLEKGKKKYKVPNATEILGEKLKQRRITSEYSLSDAGDLTGFSTSTIVDIENGVTVDINYYIAYAQTLLYPLSEFFDINIPYGPRYKLSSKKQSRVFITYNIKKLYTDFDFFAQKQSVGDVALKLLELEVITDISPFIRTRISGVLLSLVDENMLFVSEKKGRNNLYLKTSKKLIRKGNTKKK
ncbi:helix-turn-helix transcriptional regulator [Mucilaginibacter rubeus]|uniref:Helix-turn-helix transcriptional regulator n=2 Tax=Mucilaginibacter rubeus TaxID=2027860 RepID=A0A364WTJ4_9SPHI|nr:MULTISPECIES: helix-turn-helix transcriptional regulator [Mucilaginibacter]QEM06195.1 helix-turn-helix transcriptional regulator [Mucilaginibacter rubeus]QEM13712.1 helix-turn-helix transcriptional regulator [Mucilaginibacter rubeus]QEM18778.1 helix-turn-helix transcriptional regulator [Mucilaginibacter gossypii]QTE36227.1 helix-turn-helix transcriptional regulator [Mucilaginibacter gossypii]QTE44680.1 helix-turn-helix transcriptional regulator [Mucilaginibacter rubeus]